MPFMRFPFLGIPLLPSKDTQKRAKKRTKTKKKKTKIEREVEGDIVKGES